MKKDSLLEGGSIRPSVMSHTNQNDKDVAKLGKKKNKNGFFRAEGNNPDETKTTPKRFTP